MHAAVMASFVIWQATVEVASRSCGLVTIVVCLYFQLKTILRGLSILITGRMDPVACCQPGRAWQSSSSSYPGWC